VSIKDIQQSYQAVNMQEWFTATVALIKIEVASALVHFLLLYFTSS
jgi:hypothetical protein